MRAWPAAPRPAASRVEQVAELAPRLRVDGLDVDGVGPPEVVLPGDGVLEGCAMGRRLSLCRHDLQSS